MKKILFIAALILSASSSAITISGGELSGNPIFSKKLDRF